MTQAKKNLFERISGSVPLLVTVIVHVILVIVAGVFVVQEQILKPKKKFEAASATETTTAQRQIEHRLQVARKSASAPSSSSPISANRIMSTSEGALQLPDMPELPSMGAGGFGSFGSGVGMGTGTDGIGGLGNVNPGGRGFMSLTFLGLTSQNVSKIVFVLDIGPDLMDLRKGGFQAFSIIREQLMQLVGTLPPAAEFGVVIFESNSHRTVNLYKRELQPANVANKEALFTWLSAINNDYRRIGVSSAANRIAWQPRPLPNAGLNPALIVPVWTLGVQAALEMQPDTLYVITGMQGRVDERLSEAEIARIRKEHDNRRAALEKSGHDIRNIYELRNQAQRKARAGLDEINRKLKAQGKDPLVVHNIQRINEKDFQAELRKLGFSLKLDTTGWTDANGRFLLHGADGNIFGQRPVPFGELHNHLARLQNAIVPKKSTINLFLFVGPDQNPKNEMDNLGSVARRNGGRFSLLTAKRLEEIKAQTKEQP
ncbi:MAG: hypothetical protein LBK99_10880 [Opitutaceae bacterium]|jgi:hypothetical protein|nr:hypothetical protein [Opitutaceae bacterium]